MKGVKSKLFVVWIIAALLGVLLASPAAASRIKWSQPPDRTPQGMDIRCDRNDDVPRTLADDFKCRTTELITDVHLWGSWKNDVKGNVTLIHLSIHKDIPANPWDPNSYSMPGELLWEKDFFAGDFTETPAGNIEPGYEWWWDPYSGDLVEDGDQQIWRYDIDIKREDAFKQEGTPDNPIIYWLDVHVLTDEGQFGWKTSNRHRYDDAAYLDTAGTWRELRYPDDHPYSGKSIDMAFRITAPPLPYIVIDTLDQWEVAVRDACAIPMEIVEWDGYMAQWEAYLDPSSEPYPQNTGLKPEVSAYPGANCSSNAAPHSPGLLMVWVDRNAKPGLYAAAWKLKYRRDPDLTDVIITVTVLPPCDPCISTVSFGMEDINSRIRAWHWDVPAALPCGVTTTIAIDTSIPGVTAANPVASGSMSHPLFDITQVQQLLFDENCIWVDNTVVPPPGTTVGRAWNYWSDLIITPKPVVKTIGPRKWSQPPKRVGPGRFLGWDEQSIREDPPLMADDWACKDQRPVTDIHWWGSHLGWTDSNDPPEMPIAFHFGIWTDVPATSADYTSFSHPGEMIWEHECSDYKWNFVGYDKDPRQTPGSEPIVADSCFQFYCDLLDPNDWFYQQPDPNGQGRIYWLSIAAKYESGITPEYPWGWKTRPHFFQDDAVRIQTLVGGDTAWPPTVGAKWLTGEPVKYPYYISWDLSFELTTNEDKPKPLLDFNLDGINNLKDLGIWAERYLEMYNGISSNGNAH